MQHFPLLQKSVLWISASDRFVQSSLSKVVKCLLLCAAVCLPAFAQTATITTIAITSGGSAATSVSYGTAIALTATVMAGSAPVTQGLVKFCDATAKYCEDFHILGTAQLTSTGTAVLKFRSPIGSHSYNAVFVGTKTNTTSASAATSLTVTGLPSTVTTLSWSGSAANPTLSSTVGASNLSQSPAGTVSFLDTSNGNTLLGSATLGQSSTGLSIQAASSVGTTGYPTYFTIADFNQDGIPDLAVATPGTSLLIYLGNGDGTFTQTAISPE
jgi:hypothetical protein